MENIENKIKQFIEKNKDDKKAEFDKKLISTEYKIYGISTKLLENFSKELAEEKVMISQMPLSCHEEVLLAGMVLARLKMPANEKIENFKIILAHIDNWATCDMIIVRLKGLESEREFFEKLLLSDNVFYVRVGIIWFMKYCLKSDLRQTVKFLNKSVKNNDYYVDMALAWCYAEALIKDFDFMIEFIQQLKNDRVKKYAYSKACDSFRVSEDNKNIIRKIRKNK